VTPLHHQLAIALLMVVNPLVSWWAASRLEVWWMYGMLIVVTVCSIGYLIGFWRQLRVIDRSTA
jgi:hypothetical protein